MLIRLLFALLAVLPITVFADGEEVPTICVAVLIRNKEHSLPYFLGTINRLEYPKERMLIWMALDHSVDSSQEIVEKWLQSSRDLYRQVHYAATPRPTSYAKQTSDTDWPEERMERVINLKTAATDFAREKGADYIFYLDADVILMNQQTLIYLVSLNKTVVAPMLNSTNLYSNYWSGMNVRGYYQKSEEYAPIRHRHNQGVHEVPMVHSAVLVHLRDEKAHLLSFKRNKMPHAPFDDMIIFGLSAKLNGISMYIANTDFFGYLPVPRSAGKTLDEEAAHFRELVANKDALEFDNLIPEPFSYDAAPKTNMGFDKIYLINLERRSDRTEKTKRLLRIFNIEYEHFSAVDGQQLNSTYLEQIGVKMLEGYLDPFHQRPLTMGEIGCFLSHYYIWEDMVKNGYQRILILEDDIHFDPYFNDQIVSALSEADYLVPQWELLYSGRKIMDWESESAVYGASRLVYPAYSYWTVSYALTLSGAMKLLAAEPLSKMVAVDEFLPIMFNRNRNVQWLASFPVRNLIAISTNPLVAQPQLYTREGGYYSDTEASVLMNDEVKPSEETPVETAQLKSEETPVESETAQNSKGNPNSPVKDETAQHPEL